MSKMVWYRIAATCTLILAVASGLCWFAALFNGSLEHSGEELTTADKWLTVGSIGLTIASLLCAIVVVELRASLRQEGKLKYSHDD